MIAYRQGLAKGLTVVVSCLASTPGGGEMATNQAGSCSECGHPDTDGAAMFHHPKCPKLLKWKPRRIEGDENPTPPPTLLWSKLQSKA